MKQIMMILFVAAVSLSCSDSGTGPAERHFDVSLKYGIDARNELNTFNDTFTKDLILDGSVTIKLVLSPAELDSLEARFLGIDIFSYPDTFVVSHGDTVLEVTPYATYILELKLDNREKMLYWRDEIISPDARGIRLRGVFDLIRSLVEERPEYRGLPPARGGYL